MYEFWGDLITDAIAKELGAGRLETFRNHQSRSSHPKAWPRNAGGAHQLKPQETRQTKPAMIWREDKPCLLKGSPGDVTRMSRTKMGGPKITPLAMGSIFIPPGRDASCAPIRPRSPCPFARRPGASWDTMSVFRSYGICPGDPQVYGLLHPNFFAKF